MYTNHHSALTPVDKSKKVLGTLYRTMKPLLEDFNPEMTNVYDECLKGIAHLSYLQAATEVKAQYGSSSSKQVLISDMEMRNLMIEHNVSLLIRLD